MASDPTVRRVDAGQGAPPPDPPGRLQEGAPRTGAYTQPPSQVPGVPTVLVRSPSTRSRHNQAEARKLHHCTPAAASQGSGSALSSVLCFFGRFPIRYGHKAQFVIPHSLISFGWLHVQSMHLALMALIGVNTCTRMPFLHENHGASPPVSLRTPGSNSTGRTSVPTGLSWHYALPLLSPWSTSSTMAPRSGVGACFLVRNWSISPGFTSTFSRGPAW